MITVRLIRQNSNRYIGVDAQRQRYELIPSGKLRLETSPIVGDFVKILETSNRFVIEEVLVRKNQLQRPSIANVDQAIIVMSATQPEFSTWLVDQLIFLIAAEKIKPALIITKMDLLENPESLDEIIDDYRRSGYPVILQTKTADVQEVKQLIKGNVSVLAGNSGVGKSTILNRIDPTLNISTQEISFSLNRGKHTTTHIELHEVAGGLIADTPGFSTLDFSNLTMFDLASTIPDFQLEQPCRFRNCIHDKEPGCAVKAAVKSGEVSKIRYDHYKLVLPLTKERYDVKE